MNLKISLRFALSIAIASIVLFSSCSTTPDNFTVIPKDSQLVMSIDVVGLAKKASLQKVAEMEFFQSLKSEIKAENRNLSLILDEMSKDPTALGINFRDDIMGFMYEAKKDENYYCTSFSIQNRKKFEHFLLELLKSSENEKKISRAEDLYFIKLNYSGILAWDDDKALLLNSTKDFPAESKLRSAIASLFKLEENIGDNEKFKSFLKDKKDVSVWFDMDMLNTMPTFKMLEAQMGKNPFAGTFLSGYLSFEKEKISMKMHIDPGPAMMENYSEELYNKKLNKDLLRILPQKSLLATSLAINMKEYYRLMSKQKTIQSVDSMVVRETGIELKDILESLNGSVVFSLYDIKPMPTVALVFDLNDDAFIRKVLDTTPAFTAQGEIYQYNAAGIPFFFYIKKDFCIASNDIDLIQKTAVGDYAELSLIDNSTGKSMLKYPSYFNFNLRKDEYPAEIIQTMEMNPGVALFLKIIDKYASEMEMKALDYHNIELSINTNDQNNNSLFTLISLINENYQELTQL